MVKFLSLADVTIYLSAARVAFCSDQPLCFTTPSAEVEVKAGAKAYIISRNLKLMMVKRGEWWWCHHVKGGGGCYGGEEGESEEDEGEGCVWK
nr:hypothetical protein [Tanacetum cinerariifolium]